MGFVQVAKHCSRAMPDEASISLARGGSKAAVVLRIRIGKEVAGGMGWAAGQRVGLSWGHGPDVGRIMLWLSSVRTGVKLRPCGGGESGTLEVSFGHLPRHPMVADDGKEWRLGHVLRKTERASCSPGGNGLLLRLPDDWWEVADPDAELAERVEALLLKGASDEQVVKQLAITPARLAQLRERVRKKLTRSELARIRAVPDPPPARGRGNLRVGRG